MRLDKTTVAYFKALAAELGMPYQNLINLYLRDCALNHKKLELKWASDEMKAALRSEGIRGRVFRVR
jgi:antitoxin component of RelBE/YafQ-DinJ toxin-antitoxin module